LPPATLDTAELPEEEAREWRALVERVDFAALQGRPRGHGPGADRFQYDLTIVRGGERERLSVAEPDATPELRALLDRLMARGRAQRRARRDQTN